MRSRSKFGRRGVVAGALAGACLPLTFAAIALGAGSLPKPASAFTTPSGRKGKLSLTLVTSPSGKTIEEGSAAIGSQYALSGGSVRCPKVKKAKGSHETPFALFGFPPTALKLRNGSYGFSARVVQSEDSALGGQGKSFTLKVKITGTVVSPTTIKGTLSAVGGRCTTKKPLPYTAKLNPKVPVAPGK